MTGFFQGLPLRAVPYNSALIFQIGIHLLQCIKQIAMAFQIHKSPRNQEAASDSVLIWMFLTAQLTFSDAHFALHLLSQIRQIQST